ncbi:MAG TPA: phytanoyl-CoA dioxygenase family protein [Bryobacteraceae bacterium]|nr:phytanoyl-CoA dioxygenase family protein [Bryobacteraceae bacterium]
MNFGTGFGTVYQRTIELLRYSSSVMYDALDRAGYCVLQDFMGSELLAELRHRTDELFAIEGDKAGSEFRQEAGAGRLANLVAKGKVYERIVAVPEVLAFVSSVLGDEPKLSSLNARYAKPGDEAQQPLHVDMGLLPDARGFAVCNTVWLLDDFTPENGPLRVVPGSHRWGKRPQDVLADCSAPHPEEVLVTAPAGTVVVMNAHLWHGGTANRTGAVRRALHAFYCRRDIPQQQYQKHLIPDDVQAGFSPELRRVLAFDDPLNDQISSKMTRASGFLK